MRINGTEIRLLPVWEQAADGTWSTVVEEDGERLVVIRSEYLDGNTAVVVLDWDGIPQATLSVNVEGCKLPPGSFVLNHDVKTMELWMERSGVFEKTPHTISYGFVKNQPVYRIL